MAAPVVFADLYKPVKDYFSKGFVAPSFRTEYKVKGTDSILLTTVEQTNGGAVNTTADYEQTIKTSNGVLTPKIVLNAGAARFQPSLKAKDFLNVRGLTAGVSLDQPVSADKKSAADKVEPYVEFANATSYSRAAFNLSNSSAEISTTFALSKILLGGSTKVGFNGALSNYTVGASYKTPLLHVIGTFNQVLKDKSFTAQGGALYAWRKYIFGGQVTQTAKGSAILVGAETSCCGTTWRAKVNNKGLVSASAQHKVGRVVATIGGDLDTSRFAVGNVGVKFVFEE